MELLKLDGTDDTPKIIFDKVNNHYEISGRSLPEDVMTFYKPVLDWLQEFATAPAKMDLTIKLEYFNTASSKLILDILMKLEDINEKGTPISIKWHYEESDEDMQEAGEEYSELVGIPFELVKY